MYFNYYFVAQEDCSGIRIFSKETELKGHYILEALNFINTVLIDANIIDELYLETTVSRLMKAAFRKGLCSSRRVHQMLPRNQPRTAAFYESLCASQTSLLLNYQKIARGATGAAEVCIWRG